MMDKDGLITSHPGDLVSAAMPNLTYDLPTISSKVIRVISIVDSFDILTQDGEEVPADFDLFFFEDGTLLLCTKGQAKRGKALLGISYTGNWTYFDPSYKEYRYKVAGDHFNNIFLATSNFLNRFQSSINDIGVTNSENIRLAFERLDIARGQLQARTSEVQMLRNKLQASNARHTELEKQVLALRKDLFEYKQTDGIYDLELDDDAETVQDSEESSGELSAEKNSESG